MPVAVTNRDVARREDWRSFFDANVRPQLPPGLPEPTVEDVHNVIAR